MGDNTMKIKTLQKESDTAIDGLANEVGKLKEAGDSLGRELSKLRSSVRHTRKSGQSFQIVKEEEKKP